MILSSHDVRGFITRLLSTMINVQNKFKTIGCVPGHLEPNLFEEGKPNRFSPLRA
jgi:hypothetical protein